MNYRSEHSAFTSFSYLLVGFLSLFIAFPLFIFFHKQFPDYGWPFHLDRILIFLIVIIFSLLILRLFRPVIIAGFLIVLGWLAYGTATGQYGFKNLFSDYKAMMYAIKYEPEMDNLYNDEEKDFPYKKEIKNSTDYRDKEVRNFAVEAASTHFRPEQRRYEGYRRMIQCFAIFKSINENWNYVNDPSEGEYFARASESVNLMAGDCDDYAIAMAASIKAIGGTARFVRTQDHLYPEMLLNNKNELEMANYLVKRILFPKESAGQELHYHRDNGGRIWLNLDYTASYPGGKFLSPIILGILHP